MALFWALALILGMPVAYSQGIDAEFEQYKTPEGLNKHFYKGRIDSGFFRQRRTYELECSVKDYTSWGSFLYYLAPIETILAVEMLDDDNQYSMANKTSMGAFLTFFYILPPVGHLYFIHGTNGMRRLYREQYQTPPMATRGRALYYTGMALRFLMPVAIAYGASLDVDYGEMAPFLIYPLLLAGPAMQWHGMQKIDDERMFLSGGLDDVKLSPALGLRRDGEDGRLAIFGGLGLAF